MKSHEPEEVTGHPIPRRRAGAWRRRLGAGCLLGFLFTCFAFGALGVAMRQDGLRLDLPGGHTLKAGSEDFVLSNYSFQNGTTYFFDLNGNYVRHIIELHYLTDSNTLDLVFHRADQESTGVHHILTLPLP